jgi:hypothetical protein
MKNHRVRLLIMVMSCSLVLAGCAAKGDATSLAGVVESDLAPATLAPTEELLSRVEKAYDGGISTLSNESSDKLLDDLSELAKRAAQGDSAACRGIANLPLDGAYGEIVLSRINSVSDLSRFPLPQSEKEAQLTVLLLLEMVTDEESKRGLDTKLSKDKAEDYAETLLERGAKRGLQYGTFRAKVKTELVRIVSQ